MANTGILKFLTSEAATSSWVLRGFEAHTVTSPPPAFSVMARFAVSVVTWRQAAIFTPFNGLFLEKLSLTCLRTGMSLSAHSILFFPVPARPISFTWYFIFPPFYIFWRGESFLAKGFPPKHLSNALLLGHRRGPPEGVFFQKVGPAL